MKSEIQVQGHRGCRGLRPENTINGFVKALELGVHTLELDVVVNKEHEVIISHEPFFNHEISTGPDSIEITKENEKEFNLYPMSILEIQGYDVGLKAHPRFPNQKKLATTKPTLQEMVKVIEKMVAEQNYPAPEYNIEIKRVKEHDNVYHPDMKTFADVVCKEIISLGIQNRTTVQCFDIETLKYVHEKFPEFRLVLLIQNLQPYERNIANLGFKPWAYSPYFKLVSDDLVAYGKREDVKIIPWTINEPKDIEKMIDLGVDGIISDYPDRVLEILASQG